MLWREGPRGASRKLFSLYTGVPPPIGSYWKLYADGITEQGRMSVLQLNKHPYLVNSKNVTKNNNIYLILYCVKSDWFYSIQIWALQTIFHQWKLF